MLIDHQSSTWTRSPLCLCDQHLPGIRSPFCSSDHSIWALESYLLCSYYSSSCGVLCALVDHHIPVLRSTLCISDQPYSVQCSSEYQVHCSDLLGHGVLYALLSQTRHYLGTAVQSIVLYIVLGPPGCAQVFPLLEPGPPRFFWWYENSE